MRLLDTATLEFHEYFDSETPRYAILSHTWGSEEVSFRDMETKESQQTNSMKEGYKKIVDFCTKARCRSFKYGWVDTCCIDKRSSAELSEAINSMYTYYQKAGECYIYLADVKAFSHTKRIRDAWAEQMNQIKACRWLTRGWTLQELIANTNRRIYTSDWSEVVAIGGLPDIHDIISEATTIPKSVLTQLRMEDVSVSDRMSWAAHRQTTRSEDMAYSLMGLFGVNMPVLYGEGGERAFRRLQEEILKSGFDQTLFAWQSDQEASGLLADSPIHFADHGTRYSQYMMGSASPSFSTNVGLAIDMTLVPWSVVVKSIFLDSMHHEPTSDEDNVVGVLQCRIAGQAVIRMIGIHLQAFKDANTQIHGVHRRAYRRVRCRSLFHLSMETVKLGVAEAITILDNNNIKSWESRQHAHDLILTNKIQKLMRVLGESETWEDPNELEWWPTTEAVNVKESLVSFRGRETGRENEHKLTAETDEEDDGEEKESE
jgi:hypothetical protein